MLAGELHLVSDPQLVSERKNARRLTRSITPQRKKRPNNAVLCSANRSGRLGGISRSSPRSVVTTVTTSTRATASMQTSTASSSTSAKCASAKTCCLDPMCRCTRLPIRSMQANASKVLNWASRSPSGTTSGRRRDHRSGCDRR